MSILSTLAGSSPVSLSSSYALPSLPVTTPLFSCLPSLLLLFVAPSCFRTLAAFFVVVLPVPTCRCHTGAHDLPFSLLEIHRSAITPQLLSTRSLRHVLFGVPLSPSSRLRTLPLLGTRNCSVGSVSSPPARFPALPFGGLCAALPSSLG